VERDRPAETRPEQGVRIGGELLEHRRQISEPRTQRRVGEIAVGLATAAEVEPDGVVSLLDGPPAPVLVASGLVAAEPVAAHQPVVARCLVVDRDHRLVAGDRDDVSFGHGRPDARRGRRS